MKSLRASPTMSSFVQVGKQAVKAQHRPLLVESNGYRVESSVDFERATEQGDPKKKRWDYLIEGSHCPEKAHAVEIHAFDRTVLVQKKLGSEALLAQLCTTALDEVVSWNVVLVGDAPRSDLIARFQADTGIRIAGRTLRIRSL